MINATTCTCARRLRPPEMGKVTSLRLWLKRQGVYFHGVRLEEDAVHGGLKVVTTKPLDADEALVAVPESVVLSLRTMRSTASDILVAEGEFPSASVLQLSLAAERALGPASFWYPYFETIPVVEDLPFLWADEQLTWLRGTGVDVSERARRRTLEQRHSAMLTFLATHGQRSSPLCDGAAHPARKLRKPSSIM